MGRRKECMSGAVAGLPIAAGYVVIGASFGMLAAAGGMPPAAAVGMSLLVFAGASQFMAANLVAAGASVGSIVAATLVINIRHMIMASSLSQQLRKGASRGMLAALSFGITDETFAVASLQKGQVSPAFLAALEAVAYGGWVGGTIVGVMASTLVPPGFADVMGLTLYFMFMALMSPALHNLPTVVAAGAAALLSTLFTYVPLFRVLSGGWAVLAAAVGAAALAAWVEGRKGDSHEHV